jgi:signal transduction histidine kinase/DNA-binding response OmpR family regulator
MNNESSHVKILIVEDSPTQAEELKYILEKNGYQVMAAANGRDALEALKVGRPDVIISDIIMPEMNGFELCHYIKSNADLDSLPVILLTSLSDPADVISGLQCGADNFIVKPYDQRHLLSRIKQILLTRELQENTRTQMGVEIHFAGQKYFITSEKKQILDLLISTYESAVLKNSDLIKVQDELKILNEKLDQKVRERTAALSEEIKVRRQTEETLQWKTAFLEAQVNSSIDGILVVDSNRNKLLQNQRLLDLFKVPRDIAEGQDDERLLNWVTQMTKNPELFSERVDYLYSQPHEISRDEIELTNGTALDRYSSPVVGQGGNYYGRIWTFRDITEKKKLEAQLLQAQKMEAVGTLAGGVAHDFNNILNVIMGYGGILLDKMEPGSPSREHMHEILAAAERATNLTRQLLVFSRKQAVVVKAVDVNEIITGIQKMLCRVIGENIELSVNLADCRLVVLADTGQIEQVLINLAANARDAMPDGGHLTISTETEEIDYAYVSSYGYGKPGTYVIINVADTGTGMDAETQTKIFEPFFTTKEIGKGTGLGLAISYGIVKQHKGRLACYSELGKGTVFRIYLPIIEDMAASGIREEPVEALLGGSETILLAEDDFSLRELGRKVLELLGYNVITAADGEEAVEIFVENRDQIKLALLDMIMPKKSGMEVYEEIKKDSPGIKVLFMSGYTKDIISRMKPEEELDILRKPFIPDVLLRKVREVLDRNNI